VYETLPGWKEPLDRVEQMDDLPIAAAAYVEFVESQLDVEVSLVSIGAERERVVTPRGLAQVAGLD
jgi:adenylosuccinate synthase